MLLQSYLKFHVSYNCDNNYNNNLKFHISNNNANNYKLLL